MSEALQKYAKHHIERYGEKITLIGKPVTLNEKDGHLYWQHGKAVITYDGYKELDKYSNLIIKQADYVVADGQKQSNPYMVTNVTDFGGKFVDEVYYRAVGVGRAPTGNISVVDMTFYYSVTAYFHRALMKLVEQHPSVAEIVNSASITAEERTARKKVFIPISEFESIMIKDVGSKEYHEKLGQYIDNKKFAPRIAQSMCRRNIMAAHPAIGISRMQAERDNRGNLAGTINMKTWQETAKTETEFENIAKAVGANEKYEPEGETIEYREIDQEEAETINKQVEDGLEPENEVGATYAADTENEPEEVQRAVNTAEANQQAAETAEESEQSYTEHITEEFDGDEMAGDEAITALESAIAELRTMSVKQGKYLGEWWEAQQEKHPDGVPLRVVQQSREQIQQKIAEYDDTAETSNTGETTK